jgi:RNA polymerase sigma-70 factor (TIGR02943 family)
MPVATESKPAPQSSLPLRWLDNYGDSLYAYALRRVRRPEVAEDLVQETLLAGMEAFSKFSGRASVKTWLTGILRNKVSDHLRARYKDEKIEGSTLDDDAMFTRHGRWKASVPTWNVDPQNQAELTELRSVLDGCMSKLPTRMAHLFLSRAHDQISTTDLCNELQITPQNAWALLHRARSRLRQCVTTNWFTDSLKSKRRGK